jgi:peptidoglycan hydrolase-like protein with peptidoglycan-binding domain
VSWVQERTGALVDGVYGPGSAEAVADWQANHGLTADGIVGPRTHEKLEGEQT